MADLATGLQAVVDSSTTMVTWALAVGAASVAAIVSTSYLRPHQLRARLFYLLFPIGWVLLAFSIARGNAIARAGIAAHFAKDHATLVEIAANMNTAYISQQNWLMMGLATFAIWLLLYLGWWIYVEDMPSRQK
jgi:hypothetical protein